MTKILEIKNLKKTYSNGCIALKKINLSIEKGDCFALLGPNGAGKSTTIGIICTLINKSSGKVSVSGHDLDKEPNLIKNYIGLVPQEFNANRFEKIENILITQAGYYGIPKNKVYNRLEYLLEKLGLQDKRYLQAGTLSGGMMRRLMIARAMIHDPEIIILDEPTAGVDIELRHSLWDFVKSVNESGKTIILTTHYLEEAEKMCRNVAIIQHGAIAHNGSMKDFISSYDYENIILTSKTKITQPPVIENYTIKKIDDYRLEVKFLSSLGLNSLFSKLNELQIEIISIANTLNKIEQLYINITEEK